MDSITKLLPTIAAIAIGCVFAAFMLTSCEEPDRSDPAKYPRPECGITGMECMY